MKTNTMKSRKGFTLVELLVVIAIIVALAAMATPQILKAMKKVALADALNNARQVKIALNEFATDFDGQYPNDDTANELESGLGTVSSNDYFRQAILNRSTDSEKIFWAKGSHIAKRSKPDDKIKDGGKFAISEILEPGDVHWAYISEQTDTSQGSRPLVLDPYKTGSNEFDPELWDGKAIVVRIDNSANTLRLGINSNKLTDSDGNDLLSSGSEAFPDDDPSQWIKQPAKR